MMTKTLDGEVVVDLFGEPVTVVRSRRGRPSFKKDKQNQRTVAVLRGNGWSHERIAAYIGCDPKTLRKNFSRELNITPDDMEGRALEALDQRVAEGFMPAIRLQLQLAEAARAQVPQPKVIEAKTVEGEQPKPGKKEQALIDAKAPTGGWSKVLN